jgi:Na+-translocating ferredoxin:NAD+ oxidoreductase subunit G
MPDTIRINRPMRLSLKTAPPALVLTLIGLTAAVALAGMDRITAERITGERQARALAAVTGILPAAIYDNDPLEEVSELRIEGFERPATLYLARLAGQPVAAVVDVTTPRGYSGDIRLLVAVETDGTVLDVRILEHRETPGLGDRIEPRRSDWLTQFPGRSLDNPTPDGWAPDRRGGQFDTLTSATITVAAIIDAVKRSLQAMEAERDRLLAPPDSAELTT